VIGRARVRELLMKHDITFQRTKTWKESNDPLRDEKLDRIEEVLEHFSDRVFAFDEFGPLGLHPIGGRCWAQQGRPQRPRANLHKNGGVRQFHGCYSVGDDQLFARSARRRGPTTLLPHCARSVLGAPTPRRSMSSWTTSRPTRARRSAPGARRTPSNCASRPPTPRGQTRSSASSARFASAQQLGPPGRLSPAPSSSPEDRHPT
jgi:hypothetical protein